MVETTTPPPGGDLRVLVVADDHLARAGLAALLAEQQGCSVVGQVAPEEYASLTPELYRADVVVWDLGWDTTRGIEHLAQAPHADLVPIVALLPDEASAAVPWRAGVRGILRRNVEAVVFLSALTSVAQGLAVIDPELALGLPGDLDGTSPSSSAELTPRERQVLALMAEGLPNKAIARRLDISEHTVKFHVNAILGKLGAQSRTEAVTRATRMGLITL